MKLTRIIKLIKDMIDTMYEADGVGLLHHKLEFLKEYLL